LIVKEAIRLQNSGGFNRSEINSILSITIKHQVELEDVSVEGLLAGRPSGESQSSFKKWLESRTY